MESKQKFQILPHKEITQSEASDASAETNTAISAGYLHLLLRITLTVLFCLLIFTKVFLITQASGNEMFPAIKDGDLIIAFRAQQNYAKNDVVVYEHEHGKTVGRIAAFEGDVVSLDDSGILTVNGTVQNGEILYPTYAKEELTYPYKVPENSVFVLGDYRLISVDSRDCGSVPLEKVKGKVITILRRRGI